MKVMRKLFLYVLVVVALCSSRGLVLQAHAATCSATNVTTDQCYEQECTGQSEFDSASCNAYAITAAGGDAACSNITDDTVYDNCCSGGGDATNDSAVCNAYNTSTQADEGGAGTFTPSGGTGTGKNGVTQQPGTVPLNIKLQNPLSGVSTIPDAINKILSVVIRIALPLIIIMFIWAGLTFIFARGKPEEIKKAKNMFLYTIIGTLLILGAWTITNALIGTVNSIIN